MLTNPHIIVDTEEERSANDHGGDVHYNFYNININNSEYEIIQLFLYGTLCFIIGLCIGMYRTTIYTVFKQRLAKFFCCFTICLKIFNPGAYSNELQMNNNSVHSNVDVKDEDRDNNLWMSNIECFY